MRHSKSKKILLNDALVGVLREMAKPRMARSARIVELNLDTTRNPEQPSATIPGSVKKIIPSPGLRQPEKAEICVEGAEHLYRRFRIENVLTDEHGDDVRLKKGAKVEVTVTASDRKRRKAI